FKYTPDKDKRELVNEIIENEEGIAMGAQVLLNISKDERERARLTSEYKFAVDLQSKMVDAERAGIATGIATVAWNALQMNLPIDTIVKLTGMTHEEIERLRVTD
ncbi:MAG: hypothetical protein FWG63_00355, partial [Defluviitaleaceae bacterium]|nr:hypothetical protein [Defluviitaleaceae bacterium]